MVECARCESDRLLRAMRGGEPVEPCPKVRPGSLGFPAFQVVSGNLVLGLVCLRRPRPGLERLGEQAVEFTSETQRQFPVHHLLDLVVIESIARVHGSHHTESPLYGREILQDLEPALVQYGRNEVGVELCTPARSRRPAIPAPPSSDPPAEPREESPHSGGNCDLLDDPAFYERAVG